MADKGSLLTAIIIFYLSIGAAIFQILEEPHLNTAVDDYKNRTDELLLKYPCLKKGDLDLIIEIVATAAGKGVTVTGEKKINNWSWENAVIFAATVITTIGYGNVAPKTTGGRLFCILYGLCGIPLCLTWISELGTFFGSRAKRLSQVLLHRSFTKKVQFICTAVFLLWGFLVHLIIPACVFMRFEDWTYLEGLYFSFTTLTTVGFGDYVTGVNPARVYPTLYKFFVQLWICLGLAWLSLFFSWNVHMVVEAHKVLKKRRLKRHRLSIDDVPVKKEVKKAPKPPPLSGVIDIFEFMSEKVEDYNDVIQAIGADKRRKKKQQEEELARSKSCSDLLNGLVIPLDHSPRLKRRFSVSANMCMVTPGESTDCLNNNNNQEEQTLLKEHQRETKNKREEKPGRCARDSRRSDPSVGQRPVQSPTLTTNNRGSRFSVSKVSEDPLTERRKSIG
ncbi:potassium channel subfamily K member 5b isoform X2 [Puntigrus tetrazona]|uniref:potassium channel subfamily K member 5b isoform X2 n=1 Tax=Puntigrus tetrazona TaxID=1606681 RepID=UPI001C89A023|nr:potassium channel subfamily K member 5b isoform X2 [Puntigrus tetrazona]